MKRLVLVALVACLAVARPAHAQTTLLETAIYSPLAANEPAFFSIGTGPYDAPAIMATFHVSTGVVVARVGVNLVDHVNGTFYAALVKVGANGLPAGLPFNDDEVVAHTTFTGSIGDIRVPLPAALQPGNYALVLGSGRYGTAGSAFLGWEFQTPIGTPFIRVFGGTWQPWPFVSNPPGLPRLVVEADDQASAMFAGVLTRASQASVDALSVSIGALDLSGLARTSDVTAAATSLSAAVSTRASQTSVDALAAVMAADHDRRLLIERALGDGAAVATLMLPASAGGSLELVREIVDESMTGMRQVGVNVTRASGFLSKGDAAFAAGDIRSAYAWYARAYQNLVRGDGKDQ